MKHVANGVGFDGLTLTGQWDRPWDVESHLQSESESAMPSICQENFDTR